MLSTTVKRLLFGVATGLILTIAAAAQPGQNKYNSQEISESDGVPVLMKHLPDYEQIRGKATFARDQATLQNALGPRPELDMIDFAAGTEAVTAPYDAGKLVIVEFPSPQASVEADSKLSEAAASDPSIAYRRIGNYNVLVFDVTDAAAANALIDQVRYEKQIQWLGDNPFRITAERAFVMQTADLFLSTVYVILAGVGIALLGGLIAGFVYFQLRERRRAGMSAYTDAGGMTRLNLDGFTPDILPD
jgi:hypothetical protein